MSEPSRPTSPNLANEVEHLRLLGLFHLVVAAIAFLFSLIPLLQLLPAAALLGGALAGPEHEVGAALAGGLWVATASTLLLASWLVVCGLILSGTFLRRHRHYAFCLVASAIVFFIVPLGTVLAVVSWIVLLRPEVKALFAESEAR